MQETKPGITEIDSCASASVSEGEPFEREWREKLQGTELEILWDLDALERDPATAELIRLGQTMGCFYIESPSMRSLFQRMRCDCYEDVVAASSIIRPGVAGKDKWPAVTPDIRHLNKRGVTGNDPTIYLDSNFG